MPDSLPRTPRVERCLLALTIAAMLAVSLMLATAASAQHVVQPAVYLSVGRNSYDWYIDPRSIDVTVDGDDTVMVTWNEWQLSSTGNVVVVAPYALPSLHPLQIPFRTTIANTYPRPRVAPIADGGFLASWLDSRPAGGPFLQGIVTDRTGVPIGDVHNFVDTIAGFVIGYHAVAALPSAVTAIAWHQGSGFAFRLVNRSGGQIGTPTVLARDDVYEPSARIDVAATPDGGFVAAWQPSRGAAAVGRRLTALGEDASDDFTIGSGAHLEALAASPAGDVLAALFVRGTGDMETSRELWLARFTSNGTPLGPETLVHTTTESYIAGDLEFDLAGNLYVVWVEDVRRTQARGYDTAGAPLGPPLLVADNNGVNVHTARTADGEFLNVTADLTATLVSLCTPGTAVCGDGVIDALCERCDDGPANSDVAADACRTDCRPARCGDGALDTGEACDDGNRDDCDGCNRYCEVEAGLGCGDGVAFPACGETCDDANGIVGDGCSPDCRVERIPGGGAPATDCYVEWSVDNPANVPLLDKHGRFSDLQQCTDGDASCDRDGAADGTCTFAVRVCANNTDLGAQCAPGSRLATWALTAPSAAKAMHDPVAAAIRNVFTAVNGAIVGPSARDVCSADVLVPVPLRKNGTQEGKRTLKSRAGLYGGARDKDALRLVCLPASP